MDTYNRILPRWANNNNLYHISETRDFTTYDSAATLDSTTSMACYGPGPPSFQPSAGHRNGGSSADFVLPSGASQETEMMGTFSNIPEVGEHRLDIDIEVCCC